MSAASDVAQIRGHRSTASMSEAIRHLAGPTTPAYRDAGEKLRHAAASELGIETRLASMDWTEAGSALLDQVIDAMALYIKRPKLDAKQRAVVAGICAQALEEYAHAGQTTT